MTRGFQYATRGWAFAVRPDDGTTGADQLRIGDTERESAANALGEHLTAGRLTWDEYDTRLQTVYSARTRGELTPLFRDLPILPPGQQPTPGVLARVGDRAGHHFRSLPLFLVLFVALFAFAVLGWGGEHGPSPIVFVLIIAWFAFLRQRVRRHQHRQPHHHNHPRRRAVPVASSHWEPPRSR